MLFQLFISCVAIPLLYSTAPANAVHGPPTAAAAGEFPQIMLVVYEAYEMYFPAAVLSKNYVIASQILSPAPISQVKAYSGDLVNFGNALHHTVKNISRGAGFSIVKLCPALAPGYMAVSLAESDNFNYQTNTTGKMLYFDQTSQPNNYNKLYYVKKALKYRTADVLLDADCVLNNQNGTNQVELPYYPPLMTCTKFDGSIGSCSHFFSLISPGRVGPKNFPILLIGNKTAAIVANAHCVLDSAGNINMKSFIPFNKLRNMRTDILDLAVADFP